jgi:hypothetical protein
VDDLSASTVVPKEATGWRRYWLSRLAGMGGMALVCGFYYYLPFFRQAKPAIYLMTLFWYFVTLALYDILSTWS